MAEKLVKVKILKYVMEYVPGQIVEVSEEKAKVLCREIESHDGHGVVKSQKAMLLSEVEKMEKAEVDISKLTAVDMAAMGKKNIVHTPKELTHDAYLESIGVKKAEAKVAAKGKATKVSKEEVETPKEEKAE